ncbi:hypothetical protein ACYSNU_07115 [Enterococcus sp. LJL120]
MVKIGKQRKISNSREIAENLINLYFDEEKSELQYSNIVEKLAGSKYLNLSDRMKNLEYYHNEDAFEKNYKPANVFENEVRTVRAELIRKKVLKEDTQAGSYELTSSNQDELLELVDTLFNTADSKRESKVWYESLDWVIRNYLDISLTPLTLEYLTDDVQEFVNFSDRNRSEVEGVIYNRLEKMKKINSVIKTKNESGETVYKYFL